MKPETIIQLHQGFEAASHQAEDGPEFWLARDLQILLGYEDWKNFEKVIEKGRTACRTAGQVVEDHFSDTGKLVEVGSGATREVTDIAMTRLACYLTAQNGDPGKIQVAFAQTYFAVQTRRQELVVQRIAEVERLTAREKLTKSENDLSGIINDRLGPNQSSFAIIRSKGDRALFKITTDEMKTRLGVPKGRALADFLPTITIKAKDFATEVTNATIKKDDLRTEPEISAAHIKSNQDVRGILLSRGIAPETLPPAEDLKKVERRVAAETKKLTKGVKKIDSDLLLPTEPPPPSSQSSPSEPS